MTPEEAAERIVWGIEEKFVAECVDLLVDRLAELMDADDYQTRYLIERLAATMPSELAEILMKYRDSITDEVREVIEEALRGEGEERLLQEATGHEPSPTYTEGHLRLMEAVVQNCAEVIRRDNVALTEEQCRLWYRVADEAISKRLLAYDVRRIMEEAVRELGAHQTQTIEYRSGQRIAIDAAIRRHIETQVGQATQRINERRADEYGWDLWLCSSHPMSRPSHYPLQGRIFSKGEHIGERIDGSVVLDYALLEVGEVTGITGANCTHFLTVYIPGASERYEPPYSEAENQRRYDLSQKQRGMERAIRASKREVYDALQSGADDSELRMKLHRQQARVREFCKDNELVRRYDLERAYGIGSQPR